MRQSFQCGLTQTTVRTIVFNIHFVPHVPHENVVLKLNKFKVICGTIEKRVKNCCTLNIFEVLTPLL